MNLPIKKNLRRIVFGGVLLKIVFAGVLYKQCQKIKKNQYQIEQNEYLIKNGYHEIDSMIKNFEESKK